MVRRVNMDIQHWTSPWWDTQIKKKYPLIIAVDVTNEELNEGWDKWNRYSYETRVSCMNNGGCGAEHYGTPIGMQACFEQAPKNKYSFLAAVGRRYLVTWVVRNQIIKHLQSLKRGSLSMYHIWFEFHLCFFLRLVLYLGLRLRLPKLKVDTDS
jgi:hypothetical protein